MTEDELSALRAFCAQAEDARADLDNKWHEARHAMGDACPRLLDHIDALRDALEAFMVRRADLRPLLYDEFNRAQIALDGGVPPSPTEERKE